MSIRRRVLVSVAAVLYYSGLVALVRWWTRRMRQCLIILNYHQTPSDDFRRHLLYLRRHYRIMHLEPALDALYAPQKVKGHHATSGSGVDARTPLVLTFDDGYQNNYTHGFALARELHVPMTLYLVPGYIESGAHFWWMEGKRMVQHAQAEKVTVDGKVYHLQREIERATLARIIDTHVRYASSVAERENFLAQMKDALAVAETVNDEERAALPLTWEQVQAMEESGWISFGAHTMHHPILAYLTDAAEREQEIRECRRVLEKKLGHPVCSFAYPVGQMQHIGADVLATVREAGYDWALTTTYGVNTPSTDAHLLRRIEADADQHWLVVAAEAAGLWSFFSQLRWLPFVRRYLTNSK